MAAPSYRPALPGAYPDAAGDPSGPDPARARLLGLDRTPGSRPVRLVAPPHRDLGVERPEPEDPGYGDPASGEPEPGEPGYGEPEPGEPEYGEPGYQGDEPDDPDREGPARERGGFAPAPARFPGRGAPGVGERVGWPGAAPGTPAARLRFPATPVLPVPDLPAPGGATPGLPASVGPGLEPFPAGFPTAPIGPCRCGGLPALPTPASAGSFPDPDGPDPEPGVGPMLRAPAAAWAPDSWGARWAERWVPASWRGARWDPGRAGAAALAVVAVLAALVALLGVWHSRPTLTPVPPLPTGGRPGAPASTLPGAALPAAGTGPAPGANPGPAVPLAPPPLLVVSVAGRVTHPGLVRLADGARTGDAVAAAGGALPGTDLTPLNLAARVTDGEQVLVGIAPPPSAAPVAAAPAAGGPAPGPAPPGKLNLNAATAEQLDALPGVGPATAKKIVDWRTQNGRFAAADQLRQIPGIGDAKFASLKDLVTV